MSVSVALRSFAHRLFFLELAQRLLELGNVLAGGVQLLLGLRALIGERRAEQAGQG